ncbi:MAG: Ycf66 family protein [Leptolyngbyaceae cyanobacterium bins.349]|nr:Ycf66 family protein [Leptolyngbyaceae cyanobacterium bins.349]
MLAYILALLVGLGSFGLYMVAFFFPEVHRKNDFIWSGVGLFYALVLWVCAGRITGGVLLGQIAGVTLMGWFAWQTFELRRQVAPIDQQTPLPTSADVKAAVSNLSSPEGRSQLTQQASRLVGQVKDGVQGAIATATQPKSPSASNEGEYVPPSLAEFGTAGQEAVERFAKVALPDDKPMPIAVDQAPAAIAEAATETTTQLESVPDAVRVAAHDAAKSVANAATSKPTATNRQFNRPPTATNPVKVVSDLVQSLVKGFGKKESKPIYVRKEFREEPAAAPAKSTLRPNVTDATVISVIEEVGRASDGTLVADVAIEIESDTLAPDLLAGALAAATTESDATAEDIVEELLEDISAQEQLPTNSLEAANLEAIPPHPPSSEIVEAAIADAEEKGLPYDPPITE